MGLAVDTVGAFYDNSATTAVGLTALAASTGDSLSVRNFTPPSYARLLAVLKDGTANDQVQITSPMFHDDVTGLTWAPSEEPAQFLLPRVTGQKLTASDTLTVKAAMAASTDTVVGLVNFYSDLPGASARLHTWGDIAGIVKSIKTWQVAFTTNTSVGQWEDTAINTTDSQFHAGMDYAILGYQSDLAVSCLGVKGQETGNLRICGPGTTSTLDISEYYVAMSEKHGIPFIPVFNADNKASFYVSVLHKASGAAGNAYVIAAELEHTIKP